MNTTETRQKIEQRVRDLRTGTRETRRRLWLAGLGAASSVETESRELFDRLVERGRERSKKELIPVPAPLHAVSERVKNLGRTLEERVEGATSSALNRFGVPDRREVHGLIERIEQLTRKVEDLAAARS